jgi:hypothetical protein
MSYFFFHYLAKVDSLDGNYSSMSSANMEMSQLHGMKVAAILIGTMCCQVEQLARR